MLEHGPQGVTYDLPDAPHEPPRTVSPGEWLTWTAPPAALGLDGAPLKRRGKPVLVHRDPKPANIAHRDLKPENIVLSSRDATVLRGLADLGDGWVTPPVAHEFARQLGVARSTLLDAAKALDGAGLIERQPTSGKTPARYRLTDSGRSALAGHSPDTRGRSAGHSPDTRRQGGEGGVSSSEASSGSSLPPTAELPPSPDPGPIDPSAMAYRPDTRGRSAGHSLLDALLDDLADRVAARLRGWSPEKTTDDEEEDTEASAPPPPAGAPGDLRWTAETLPELAEGLAEFRDRQTTRDGARPWEDSRRVEAAWCMRAYAHAVWRLLRPLRGARRVRDAWGLYLSTVAKLVAARGDAERLALQHEAMLPDSAEAFRVARAAYAEVADRRDRVEKLARSPVLGAQEPPNPVTLEVKRMNERLARMQPVDPGAVLGALGLKP